MWLSRKFRQLISPRRATTKLSGSGGGYFMALKIEIRSVIHYFKHKLWWSLVLLLTKRVFTLQYFGFLWCCTTGFSVVPASAGSFSNERGGHSSAEFLKEPLMGWHKRALLLIKSPQGSEFKNRWSKSKFKEVIRVWLNPERAVN